MCSSMIDEQKNEFAKATFAQDVQQHMVDNGFPEEAVFCKVVQEW